MEDVIIIGAGVSGLVAAIELEKSGISPLILEASDSVGGRVKTTEKNGFYLDHGFQVLLTAYPEAKRYLDLDALKLVKFKPGSAIYHNKQITKIGDPTRDKSFLISTLFAKVGSLRDKIIILKLNNLLKQKSMEEIFASAEKTTLDHLKDFGFSEKIISSFFQPFFAGIFLEEELSTSSRMFEFVYKLFGTGYAAIPAEGIKEIPLQLASSLKSTKFRFNSKVVSLNNSQVELDTGEKISANRIIISTDPSDLIKTQSKKVKWKSCYNLYFETEKSTLNEPIIGLLPGENTLVNNIHFLQDIFGSSSEKNVLSVTVVKDHSLTEEQLVTSVKNELQNQCGIAVGNVVSIFPIKKALPDSTNLKYQPSSEDVMLSEGLYCCGDYLANSSLNAAMASGRVAAEQVFKSLKN